MRNGMNVVKGEETLFLKHIYLQDSLRKSEKKDRNYEEFLIILLKNKQKFLKLDKMIKMDRASKQNIATYIQEWG